MESYGTHGLEVKFCRLDEGVQITEGNVIEGYASLFGKSDQGGDIVQPGAYAKSLSALTASGRQVKMLWQHDPAHPIGKWEEVREDAKGLYVKGHLLNEVEKGREAAALIGAGAIDGLSIGYRTKTASRDGQGRRLLTELELWEVSLVTFPMLPEARIAAKRDTVESDLLREMTQVFRSARESLAR